MARLQGRQRSLSHSRIAAHRACPRRHELRYIEGLRPAEESESQSVGAIYHRIWEHMDADGGVAWDEVRAARLDDLIVASAMWTVARDAFPPVETVETELAFDLPLRNPATGGATPTWRWRGVIDGIVRLADGRLMIMERKTTTMDVRPGSDAWHQWELDHQAQSYLVAARALGHHVEGVLYEAVRRPLLRRLRATAPDKLKFRRDGRPYANQRLEDESDDAFYRRLVDHLVGKRDTDFVRIEIPVLDADLRAVERDLWAQQKDMAAAIRHDRWPRNTRACLVPWRCDYLAVCASHTAGADTPPGFIRGTGEPRNSQSQRGRGRKTA